MIIQSADKFNEFLREFDNAEEYVFDCETTGLELWFEDRICGIGFYFPHSKNSYYLPFRHKRFDEHMTLLALLEPNMPDLNLPLNLLPSLWEAMRKPKRIIGHNIKFDLAAVTQDGFFVGEDQEIEDTLCGARLYFHEKHPDMSLENLCRELIGVDDSAWKQKFKNYLKDRKIEKHYDRAEVPVIAEYCEADAKNTFLCRERLVDYAKQSQQWFIYEEEIKVLKILWNLELRGLRTNQPYISETIPYLRSVANHLETKMVQITGKKFNPWSNPELTSVFADLGIKVTGRTQSGGASWSDENLQKVTHEIGKLVLDWRAIDKLLNTYFIPYHGTGEYVHCSFKSWGVVTGRLACVNPNLQQVSRNVDWSIADHPDFDVQVRKMFIPDDDYYLYCMDFAQMEMIVFSDYLEDEELRAQLATGDLDFHSLVAKMIWKVGEDHPDFRKVFRLAAKSISLGLVYGMGESKLAKKIGCSNEQAAEYKKLYFKSFPTAPTFISKVHRTIETRGYVFNRFGRRYYLPKDKAYAAVNYLVQGTSADIIKQAMIRIDAWMRKERLRSTFRLQMHDEFDFYIHKDELDAVPVIHQLMEEQVIKTYLPVDVSRGNPNWSQKVNICRKCYQPKLKEHSC